MTLPKMDTTLMAVDVKSTFGAGTSVGGVPDVPAGNRTPDRFDVEAVDSREMSEAFPDLPAYWNVNAIPIRNR